MSLSYKYETEHCYPDVLDLERILRSMSLSGAEAYRSNPEAFFQDFVACHDWVLNVLPCLHNHGKHLPRFVTDIKAVVERFVGRELHTDAFLVACHEQGLSLSGVGKFQQVKVPSMARVAEVLPRWNEYIAEKIEAQRAAA